MVNKYIFIFIIIISVNLLITGCGTNGITEANENKTIFLNLMRDSLDFEMDFDLIKHIYLESTDESLYVEAKKMWIIDSTIYLLDYDIDHRKLLSFHSTGHYLTQTKSLSIMRLYTMKITLWISSCLQVI